MSRLITDDAVEAALHVLATTAEAQAAARAMRLRCEFKRKRILAMTLLACDDKTADARKAQAEASPGYAEAVEAECRAVERDELLRCQRNDAAVVIEAWRTEQASNRAGNSFR
jgi:hypothetical protein